MGFYLLEVPDLDADLLERAGDAEAARAAWHQGAEVADNPGQRAEMLRQARA